MIVTVTPNPSIDRTVTLSAPLTRGAVHRVSSVTTEPGGKGVNVARALMLAGLDAMAVLPAPANDPLVAALQASAVPFRCVPSAGAVRTNLAITEHDGTTTKLNEPGAALPAAALDALTRSVVASAQTAAWVVLSGSLPPGVPDQWYADVVALLAPLDCRVAVDTSDDPLAALAESFDRAAPDLIKPNSDELASITGASAVVLESAAAQGDPGPERPRGIVLVADNEFHGDGGAPALILRSASKDGRERASPALVLRDARLTAALLSMRASQNASEGSRSSEKS